MAFRVLIQIGDGTRRDLLLSAATMNNALGEVENLLEDSGTWLRIDTPGARVESIRVSAIVAFEVYEARER